MQIDREALVSRLIEAAKDAAKLAPDGGRLMVPLNADEAHALLTALASQEGAQAGEVVAWQWRSRIKDIMDRGAWDAWESGRAPKGDDRAPWSEYEERPLYTTPPAPDETRKSAKDAFLDMIAAREGPKEAAAKINELADILMARGADKIRLEDKFPDYTRLVMPLNDPDDREALVVAQLDIEDGGLGPMLWTLALMMLRARKGGAA